MCSHILIKFVELHKPGMCVYIANNRIVICYSICIICTATNDVKPSKGQYSPGFLKLLLSRNSVCAVLEITVDHWPFSDQFQHLADISCVFSMEQ